MANKLFFGFWRLLMPLPSSLWESRLPKIAQETYDGLAWMAEDHHRVREYVVLEIARQGKPLSPVAIAQALDLPADRLAIILDELEKGMTFLFRNEQDQVAWAYPVTAERTPHAVKLDTGDQFHAAWAIDAVAVPFVQGLLRKATVVAQVDTTCACCGRPMRLEIDAQMNYRILEGGPHPMIFVPLMDVNKLDDPSIIDAFWANSVFFWSEEHARKYRNQMSGLKGLYLTLPQATQLTPFVQGALFNISPQVLLDNWRTLMNPWRRSPGGLGSRFCRDHVRQGYW